MTAPKIEDDAPLDLILDENSFTLGQLPTHPLAAPFAAQFDAFQTQWEGVDKARTALVIARGKAEGAVVGADGVLDDFIDLLDRTLLIATKNDRKAPLYQLYFGLLPPSLLKKPILGDELATVRAYVTSLQGSPVSTVSALAPALVTAVAGADTAIAQRTAADQAIKDFDAVGPKMALIAAFNALRKTVDGELAALPHQHPEAMLPATFADRFFRHNAHKGISSIKSVKEVDKKIDSLTADLAAAQAHKQTLVKAAADKEAAKQAKLKHDADIAAAKKERDAAEQKLKDLEKQK